MCPCVGGAYFGMAVLYDNLGKATKAMEFYRRFLQVHTTDKTAGKCGVADMGRVYGEQGMRTCMPPWR